MSNWAMWSSGWASCSRRSPGAAPGHVLGDVVAIEVSIRGTFLGPFETPAGVIQPTGGPSSTSRPPTSDMCATAVNDTRRETRCDGSQILKNHWRT